MSGLFDLKKKKLSDNVSRVRNRNVKQRVCIMLIENRQSRFNFGFFFCFFYYRTPPWGVQYHCCFFCTTLQVRRFIITVTVDMFNVYIILCYVVDNVLYTMYNIIIIIIRTLSWEMAETRFVFICDAVSYK